jgi:enoyl-CoA hydratase/carnithine racemase
MPDEQPVILEERRGAVLLITMNRPERHHALNQALNRALSEALERANRDPEVAVTIVTGSGEKAFCAGADMLEASGVEQSERPTASAANVYAALSNMTIPVIAAINGYCYGGGARLAVGCDILLASENASFRLPGSEYGLVVAAATLPRLVGAARAKELIFTARKFTAQEAFDYGLVAALHPLERLLPAAWEMAETIASHSRGAVRDAKRVIDAATLSEQATEMENAANRQLRGSEEQVARFRDATRRVTGR